MKYALGIFAALALFAIAATSAATVRSRIDDYQETSACRRADLNFDGRVNLTDLRMISGDPISGDGGFFLRSDYPFWYEQDGDGVISILDISRVASLNGRTC